jgi:hypothetical protein
MRLLLDECGDQALRHFFEPHECHSAAYARLAGLKNGELLSAAEQGGFEVLITTDQEIPHQQNLRSRRISVLILHAPTNRLADLKNLVPAALRALESLRPGHVFTVRARPGAARQ